MNEGRANDAEIETMCDFTQWLRYAEAEYPEDMKLKAFVRICRLKSMQRLLCEEDRAKQKESRCIEDRIAECGECEREGYMRCRDESQGYHCKFYDAAHKLEYIKKNFGDEAFEYLNKYANAMNERLKSEMAEGEAM